MPMMPIMPIMPIMNDQQRAVVDRVLVEEQANRQHVVIALSGAHAYGFPSPDSDFDLKAIHVAPTALLLGLGAPRLTFDRMEIIDGVEIDYTSNELQMVLSGILKGNGNYLERVLGPIALTTSKEHESLRPLVERSLSRRVHHHYHGFASGQLAELDKAAAPTAKKLLYVLRTAITGTHLLRTGQLVTDLGVLLEDYQLGDARQLIEQKKSGERVTLDGPTLERWRGEVARVFALLEAARETSPLPEEPTNRDEIEAWLVDLRRRRWNE